MHDLEADLPNLLRVQGESARKRRGHPGPGPVSAPNIRLAFAMVGIGVRGGGQLDEPGAVHAQQRDLATHGLGFSRGIEPAEFPADTARELFAAEGVLREPGADGRQLLLGKIATAKTQGILRGIAFHGAGPRG